MGQNFTRFEVEFECKDKNITADCGIGWTQTQGAVSLTDIGGMKPRDFESNGDIAGIGILLSFVIPTVVMLIFAFLMFNGMWWHLQETKTASHGKRPIAKKANTVVPSPHSNRRRQGRAPIDPTEHKPFSEKEYDFFEATLVALSDYQIIFAAAVCLHFGEIGKCNISMYHFNIGINLITIALANTLVTVVFLRNFWKTPISSLARIIIFGMLLFFQGQILWTLKDRADVQGTVESRPWKPRKNSLTLLPAVCFLDPDPLRRLIKQLKEPPEFFTAKTDLVGPVNADQRWQTELNIWCGLVGLYTLVVLYQLFSLLKASVRQCRMRKAQKGGSRYHQIAAKKPPSRGWMWSGVVICGIIYAACFFISIYRIIHVFHVREWVLFSGWMKDQENLGNPETNFASLGQVAALVTMAGFVIVGFDKLTWQAGDQG